MEKGLLFNFSSWFEDYSQLWWESLEAPEPSEGMWAEMEEEEEQASPGSGPGH